MNRRLLTILSGAAVAVVLVVTVCVAVHKCSATGEGVADTEAVVNPLPIDTLLRCNLDEFAHQKRVEGNFAFHVFDITAEKPVYGYNETMALPSASCMKLLSGIAGLHLLGIDYRYETKMMTRGKMAADGMLNGDIAFVAGLHPQLMEADLTPLAQKLKNSGIRKLSGKLYVDLIIDEPVKCEEHWFPWDLSFSRYGLLYKGEQRIVRALRASLRAQGIAVADSQVTVQPVPQGFKTIASANLSIDEVIKRMWKNSSNTQSTSLLYTIGHAIDSTQDPVKTGVRYMNEFLRQEVGVSDSTIVIHDGCGLCTHNRLTPQSLTSILYYGYKDEKIRESLMRNLSVAGVDGTLAREMTGPRIRGKVWAKTGTLSHPYGISTLAGFCKGADGHWLAFAVMSSEMSVLDARVLQRKLCEMLNLHTD